MVLVIKVNTMIDYTPFFDELKKTKLKRYAHVFRGHTDAVFQNATHGDLPAWLEVLTALPVIGLSEVSLDRDTITIGSVDDCDMQVRQDLRESFMRFHPWRKGPFDICGIHIDTEWRSDMKWNRLKDEIASLDGRLVLDVGCGNGYHCFRAAGAGARLVFGADPYLLYCMQYAALNHYIGADTVAVLPFSDETMPAIENIFDTVFSMGVLYHQRSPLDHLCRLRSFLRKGGELVLETLIVDGDERTALFPEGRYAKMNNVWFIPSCGMIEVWLRRIGFSKARTVNVAQTTLEEQHATSWMGFESLSDFLDPADQSLTIEGYPAPKRAIFIATC